MISKANIKFIRSLRLRKFRQKYDKFVVEGHKSCIEFLKSEKFTISSIIASKQWMENYGNSLDLTGLDQVIADAQAFTQISNFKTPSQVMLVCDRVEINKTFATKEYEKAIYLENIQDPGNLGTIIRIADWFGIKAIIQSSDTVDVYNPKVVSSTMGSLCNVDLYELTPDQLTNCHEFSLLATDMDGQPISNFSFPDKSIVIIGNEGKGISQKLLQSCAHRIAIPGNKSKLAESLNAAVATGILCSYWSSK